MPELIEGVPTDVAGFVGLGGLSIGTIAVTAVEALDLEPGALASAAQAFFVNGGRKLYLSATLAALAEIPEIAIVAAPDASALTVEEFETTTAELIAHADSCRYRIAVLDGPLGASPSEIAEFRRHFDSARAALYHPWITMAGALGPVSPSGAVAGILSRTAVYGSPTGPIVSALGLVGKVGQAATDALTQLDVNVLRSLPGGAVWIWGARTMSSDAEWKYLSVTRLAAFLEHSIEQGTLWAVFEANEEPLWASVRDAVGEFLHAQWVSGAFPSHRSEEAFFVRCDRTTMTQDDVDNGRLVCVVGFAPVRPAEFVILRIGQWTAHSGNGD